MLNLLRKKIYEWSIPRARAGKWHYRPKPRSIFYVGYREFMWSMGDEMRAMLDEEINQQIFYGTGKDPLGPQGILSALCVDDAILRPVFTQCNIPENHEAHEWNRWTETGAWHIYCGGRDDAQTTE